MRKHIVVTGGTQGIGKVVSLYLLEKGCRVTILEIDNEAINEMNAEIRHEDLQIVEADVSKEQQVKAALELAVESFGSIDVLINNAMIDANKPVEELKLEEWEQVIAVNLTGPFLCAKHSAKSLRKTSGCIINICSTRALQSEPNTEAYSASKGGLLALTHSLAMSLGPEVRVNAISPGWIDVSAIHKKSIARQVSLSEEDHRQHPVGRVGKPEDIANMIWFLVQPENDFITGQNFIVDGGMTKKMIYVE